MDPRAVELFNGKNLVYVATLMADGAPQVSPVWADYADGHVRINTAEGRVKHRNVVRDPRVAVSAVDRDDPLRMTTVRGVVTDILPDYDYVHADMLTRRYVGRDRYPFKRPGERRIILRIRPNRVFVMPELHMSDE